LNGEKIDYPYGARGMDATFRKARRYREDKQIKMDYSKIRMT
jgi:hypothetical protein